MSRKRSNGEWTDEEWSKWASRTGYFARQRRRMLRHPQPQPPSQNAQNAAPENVQPTEHASNDCPNDCVKRQHSPQSLWLVCMKLVWLSCNMLQHLTSKFWYHSDFHPLGVSWIRLRHCRRHLNWVLPKALASFQSSQILSNLFSYFVHNGTTCSWREGYIASCMV